MEQKPEQVISPEAAPRLKAVEVEANTVGEAIDKAGGTPAGRAELDWVLNPANFAKAKEMLKEGKYFLFPGAADGGIPYVYESDNRFWQGFGIHRDGRWDPYDRVVLMA